MVEEVKVLYNALSGGRLGSGGGEKVPPRPP
jgi:hypothetical protein